MGVLHFPARMDSLGVVDLLRGEIPVRFVVDPDCFSPAEVAGLACKRPSTQGVVLYRYNISLTEDLEREDPSVFPAWALCMPRLWQKAVRCIHQADPSAFSLKPLFVGMREGLEKTKAYTANLVVVSRKMPYALVIEHDFCREAQKAESLENITAPRASVFDYSYRGDARAPGASQRQTQEKGFVMMAAHYIARPSSFSAGKALERFIQRSPTAAL